MTFLVIVLKFKQPLSTNTRNGDFTVCLIKKGIESLLEEGVYQEQILKKRISMLDLLEKYEACEIRFERF